MPKTKTKKIKVLLDSNRHQILFFIFYLMAFLKDSLAYLMVFINSVSYQNDLCVFLRVVPPRWQYMYTLRLVQKPLPLPPPQDKIWLATQHVIDDLHIVNRVLLKKLLFLVHRKCDFTLKKKGIIFVCHRLDLACLHIVKTAFAFYMVYPITGNFRYQIYPKFSQKWAFFVLVDCMSVGHFI